MKQKLPNILAADPDDVLRKLKSAADYLVKISKLSAKEGLKLCALK
jgi:hypothetical protein